MAGAPRIFLSYSHDSAEHKDCVLALCDRLRQDGLDAWIDQYESNPPEGWPRWTERQLEIADFVLVVCTESYIRRFRGLEEPGRGRGASWEGAIITQALYEAAAGNTKFVPVVFSSADEAHIPIALRGVTRYRVDLEEGYEALYRYLTNQPAVPPLEPGPLRKLPPRPRPTPPSASGIWRKRGLAALIGLLILVATLAAVAAARRGTDQEEGEQIREEAPSLQVLRGEIRDEQSREPLPGVHVELPEYGLEHDTDEKGQYRFELDVPADTRVKLWATKEGYEPLNLDPSVGDSLDTFRMRRSP